jgi:hypothetical protein
MNVTLTFVYYKGIFKVVTIIQFCEELYFHGSSQNFMIVSFYLKSTIYNSFYSLVHVACRLLP